MKTWATLYQKTNTGAIQQWTISVEEKLSGGLIVTVHGQVGGKLQETSDLVSEGKNPGKKNATTPVEQALKEADAKWIKQKKKGYVESYDDAVAEKLDAVIEGGLAPMLAPNKSYPKDDELQKRITFPCYFQPKLDGMRCIAIIEDGVCTLWSRTRKRIPTVPHIAEALAQSFPTGRVVLDGEIYNHDYKDRFEDLMSILRGNEPDADGEYLNAQYHVYDCPEAALSNPTIALSMADVFECRNSVVGRLFMHIPSDSPIKRVQTNVAASMQQLVLDYYEDALTRGYEGGMARNANGTYESDKRSKNLQKMKEFIDEEFPIVGVQDGRGKDAGTVATFLVRLPCGSEVPVRLKATYAKRREYMHKPELWQGKTLTVCFKRWTADRKLYLPVAKAIRDYE
jgi:DNA ligase-1